MPWILDLNDLKAHAEDGRWELDTLSDGSVIVRFYTKHGSVADILAAQGFAQEGTEIVNCGQRDRDATILAQSNVELLGALDELTSAVRDGLRRHAAADPNAIASNLISATLKQAERMIRKHQ